MRPVHMYSIALALILSGILGFGARTAQAITVNDATPTIYLPYVARASQPGECKNLELVAAWRLAVSVQWSDSEGPTTLDRNNGAGPQTYTASAEQATAAVAIVPTTSELIYDEATGNIPIGRAFRTLVVTGTNSFVGDETVVTPPDGAGGSGSTVTTHWNGDGALTGNQSSAKVSIFGGTCKFNLDLNVGRVDLHQIIQQQDHIDPNVVSLLYLRQVDLPSNGIVSGSATIVPSLTNSPSPYLPVPPQALVMGYRLDITAWRQGKSLNVAQITWRLEPAP